MRGLRTRPASVRMVFGAATLLVAVLAASVGLALVVFTTVLRATTERSADGVESVRLAEEAQIELLLHERTRDPFVRRAAANAVVARLRQARELTSSAREGAALDEAERTTKLYFDAASSTRARPAATQELLGDAHAALDELVTVNVAQSRADHTAAARWDRIANVVGLAVMIAVATISLVTLYWLSRRAFRPMLELAEQMDRFGKGDREARAVAEGPREIREMATRFNEMADALASQRRAQVAFLGSVAHDLRTPLSAMQMSTSLLAARHGEGEARQLLRTVERQIGRMNRMLGDFLDVSRIEAGVLQLRPETVDVRDLVTHVVGLFEDTSTHRMRLSFPEEPSVLTCDPLRIEQVIVNLVSNAIKYSPESSTIGVEVEEVADGVRISVSDEGIGISEHDRERVFEPFRRVGGAKDLVPGVGLGLFAVRRIVEAHGGSIAVESKMGSGSTFRIDLPRSIDRTVAAATHAVTH